MMNIRKVTRHGGMHAQVFRILPLWRWYAEALAYLVAGLVIGWGIWA